MVKFEQFESVWDAIETGSEVAANLKARTCVMMAIVQIVKSWRTS